MSKPMKNLLIDRRNGSDLMWAVRKLNPVESYKVHHTLKTQKQLYEEVLELVIGESEEISHENRQVITSKVISMVDEIYCSYNQPLIRCLSVIFSKLLKHYYSGVFVNEEAIIHIKNTIGNSPVIFVPSHRSYCDFIIMAFICFAFEIEIPCVAAAIDFSSMKIIGNILRDCKAFFIRRNFNTDSLYKYIFQRFLQYLVIYGNSPIEFFIEGTRSRTGKALLPKFGLLKTIIDTFIEKDVPDLIIIPICISYDRVLEDLLFSYELLGIPKPRETTKGFFKALANMDDKYGNIFINFGQPISLKSFLMKHDSSSPSEDPCHSLEQLGFHIIKEQQRLQNILCIHLLSLALHDQYMKNGVVSLTFSSACSHILTLKSVLTAFGAVIYLSDDIESSLKDSLLYHKSLFSLSNNDIITFSKTNEKTFETYGIKLKATKLDDTILNEAVAVLRLQQYINPVLNVLATPALTILLIPNCLTYVRLKEKYKLLRELFSNEFIFAKENEEKDLQSSINCLLELEIIELTKGDVNIKKQNSLSYTLSCVMYPFLITYQCTTKILMTGAEKKSFETVMKSTQSLIQDRIKRRHHYHHASLSLDTIGQAVNSLLRLQAISKENLNGCDSYMVTNSSFLRGILDELDLVVKNYNMLWKERNNFTSLIKGKL